ncbi:hypothetical protein [Sphingomonas adhaesiva]|uniref:hypothetical protein n=1 Tax=Sphingomonas adhaesiva TaxID=28212 RepID=UPI002FFC1E8C
MIALQVARIVAHIALFLDTEDEDVLELDAAVDMQEWLAKQLSELDPVFLRELVDAFAVIAPEYSGDVQKSVRDIPYHFYLEEELAQDDPVRLAELDAIRDSRED